MKIRAACLAGFSSSEEGREEVTMGVWPWRKTDKVSVDFITETVYRTDSVLSSQCPLKAGFTV